MENEREDWFTDGWSEDGGIVSDARQEEALPEEESGDARAEGAEAEEAGRSGTERSGAERPGAERAERPEDTDAAEAVGAGPGEEELIRFIREFPQVRAEDIPLSVWDSVARGESLVSAWSRHEAEELRRENSRLREENRRRERNRVRSAGSQRGVGASASVRDAFDDGWEGGW